MFVDPRSGEVTEVSVFVCTLPYSGYFYAEGFLDMTMQNWITGHRDAFDFFEGTPLVLSPDNCATVVDIKKQWWDDAILNTQYCAFADHFCITLKPARPLAPRDKGAVERSVGVVEADIIPEMNRIDIYSLEEFNRILWKKMSTRLEKRYSKKSFSRKDIFISEEKQTLQPLPACEFELYAQKTAVVGRDFHIQYDSAFYSVPVDFIKSKVTVRATSTKVRIYDGKMVLIAEHSRATHKWQRCTDPSHIPEGHAPTIAYSRDAFINKASGYGDELVEWVESVLGRFEFEVQGYRPVNAVLCSISRFHPESVLKAARLAGKACVYSSKGFLTCCRQFEAKLGSGNEEEVQPSLDDLFCSHSASKEGAR